MKRKPELITALLCEAVTFEEPEHKTTAERLVTSIVQTYRGVDAPQEMPPFIINLTMLVVAWPGEGMASERTPIVVDIRFPTLPSPDTVHSTAAAIHGHPCHITVDIRLEVLEPGRHRFRMSFGGYPIAEVPLEVQYVRNVAPHP